MRYFYKFVVTFFFFMVLLSNAIADPSKKTKFYNFDDLLINGEVKKPQVLWTDARQKIKFDRLLKLKKDFIPKLKATKSDPSLD